LNGYFVTDLVIHSNKKGLNDTQIDAVGVRFPFHEQKDREIACSEKLCIPENKIDVLICEVKDTKGTPDFNKALTDNLDTIKKLLSWIGILNHSEIEKTREELRMDFKTIENDTYSIRPTIFTFGNGTNSEFLSISGKDTLDFIWECLRPNEDRENCSTIYNYEMWGDYTEIVKYFKNMKGKSLGDMDGLYKHFGIKN